MELGNPEQSFYSARMSALTNTLIEEIKATPRQPDVEEIRIPSERAFRSRERALCEGLNIDRLVFDALVALRAPAG